MPRIRVAVTATTYTVSEMNAPDWSRVDARTVLKIALAPGGGAAISLKPATADDVRALKAYGAP